MASVFISYSRIDREFVAVLRAELERSHHDAWVDLQDIPPSADWEREIGEGIDGADTFVCVLSPEWLASPTCQMELSHAEAAHKRLVPLVRRDVQGLEVPSPVRAANWIFFRAGDDGDAAFRQLLFAIDTDLDYWHLASRVQLRATQWEKNRQNTSFALRGKELAEAEHWLAEGAEKQPSPTALQTRFITASRRASSRRQRTIISTLSGLLALAVVLATVASIQTVRVGQQNTQLKADNASLFARALAGESSAALVNKKLDQALLLGDAATQQEDTFVTRNALLDTLEYSSHLAAAVTTQISTTQSGGGALGVSFSADGKTLMYAEIGQEGRITLWDTATRRTRVQYSVSDTLYGAALSPDGTQVATLGIFNGLVLRDAASGTQLEQLAAASLGRPDGSYNTDNVDLQGTTVAFSRNGSRLAAVLCDDATCGHPYIGVWNARSHGLEGKLSLDFRPLLTSLAFAPDGGSVAATECNLSVATQVCQIAVWDLSAGQQGPSQRFKHVMTAADGAPFDVESVAFSPDGAHLYTGGCTTEDCAGEGRILTWDAASGSRSAGRAPIVAPSGDVTKIAFSPDGRYLVTADPVKEVVLWDAQTMQPIGSPLVGHNAAVSGIAFAPDSSSFATSSNDDTVLLWRIGPFTPYSMAMGADLDDSSQVVFSPDGKLIATANCDGVVRLWDTATRKLVTRLSVPNVPTFCLRSLAFSPDGKLLAARLDEGSTLVWNVASDALESFCDCSGMTGDLLSIGTGNIAFSPDSALMAVPAQNTNEAQVVLASAETGSVIHTFTNAGGSAQPGSAFSPDGKLLAVGTGGKDNTGITLWDLSQQKADAVLQGRHGAVGALAYTHDGRDLIALDSDGVLTVWDMAKRTSIGSLDLHNTNGGDMSLSLNRNGWLLAVSISQTIWLVDLRNPGQPQLYVHALAEPSYVHNVAFSPDGTLLAAKEDVYGVVVRWATLDAWRQQACTLANRNFSHAEWSQFFGPQGLSYAPICPGLTIPG